MTAPEPGVPDRIEELSRIGRVAALAGDGDAVAAALEERRVWLRRLAADRAGVETARALAVLEHVRILDAETGHLLRQRLDRLRDELRALGEGRRGLAGYAGKRLAAGSRIDERG